VAWIKSHGEIGPAAFFVSSIDGYVQVPAKVRADRRHQMPACRKTQHSDFLRIDMPFGSVKPDESDRPLSIIRRLARLRIRS
jgi:hypothetical protein